MNEIKCPKCNEKFSMDAQGFASILKQVKDEEFAKELEKELKIRQFVIAQKNDKEKAELSAEKEKEIAELKGQLSKAELEKKLAVSEAISKIEKESSDLKNELSSSKAQSQIEIVSLKERHQFELKGKDELIDRYKDMKAKLSTKLVGESLEQHCETEFNKLRMTAFKNAQFGKDNDHKQGTKGDYIYRDFDESGNEIVSIMFEMKNEEDLTATKKRNEDFFDKLHKDRVEKKCEYAVLVSLLEIENEFYNAGIADVSFRHEKMYVIRPQCFIPMITLLKNAAQNSMHYKKELALIREQNIDIENFEDRLNSYKGKVSEKHRLANERFQEAITEIDNTIIRLEKAKEALITSEKHFRIADQMGEKVTIKTLSKGNQTMIDKFELN
ncbi:MAG: DUF2130 domain-containing protein [Firmicutes bacterium]|nr:DUF2130 domain-containing protein [Bacillota bacterium]